jgi:hypothetical protein
MAISASDVFSTIFSSLTGISVQQEPWVAKLWDVAKPYIDSGQVTSGDPILFDLILSDQNAPEEYKQRFSAIATMKANNASFIPTVAQYLTMESNYKTVLNSVGLYDLATNDEIKKFIENNVSVDEMSARVQRAFTAIDTADEVTKSVLAERFPGLTRQDVARGLLLGKESYYEINKKIENARVAAEARRAGIQSTLAEEDVAAQGLSQQQLRTAFQRVATETPGIRQASQMFAGGISDTEIQKQQEQEQLMGIEGTTVRRLRSQARAQFAGTSGITTGSLSRKKQV